MAYEEYRGAFGLMEPEQPPVVPGKRQYAFLMIGRKAVAIIVFDAAGQRETYAVSGRAVAQLELEAERQMEEAGWPRKARADLGLFIARCAERITSVGMIPRQQIHLPEGSQVLIASRLWPASQTAHLPPLWSKLVGG